jgi:excisionase family DNA binding protein
MGDHDYVTIMQACDIAGVSRRTIYNWLKKGKIPFVRTAGGSVRINKHLLFVQEPSKPAAPVVIEVKTSVPITPQAAVDELQRRYDLGEREIRVSADIFEGYVVYLRERHGFLQRYARQEVSRGPRYLWFKNASVVV